MRKAQTTFQNVVTFVFIVVGVIVVSIFASVTTPFLVSSADASNITGGMGLVARYWNILLVTVLLFIGLVLAFSRGGAPR